ncbi:hypothetical protein CJ030_MR2G004950 [Morella rubra]|uniref:Probable cytosolic iron-sulfur protein assembly protein CIAO1 homolog n=1 Tax=Morella rubra TaxID=262757 RepID=A0A6A1WFY7_9ROSI|nr:hypothetical protein CJ030_MR2G004950 [Morella rubra]
MELYEGGCELKLLETLEGHSDRVWSLSWNPATGAAGVPLVFASCSGDKTVRIWEHTPSLSASWTCKAVLEDTHTRTVRSCSWSPSGKLLATGSFDATAAIWENIGGDYECVSTLEGHESEVKSVSWNAAGTLLATCARDKSVWIWEVQLGNDFECVCVLQGHTQDVKMVQWHPATDVLFSCSYDNTVKVWADEDGDDEWRGHSSTVWAISFNASGDKMVTCSDDLTLKIWETDNVQGQNVALVFTYTVGDILIVKGLEGFVSVDISDRSAVFTKQWVGTREVAFIAVFLDDFMWRHLCTLSGYHDRTIFSVHWSSEGIIASGAADDAIRVFVEDKEADGPSYKLLLKKEKAHDMDVNSVQWSPGEKRLLASASDDGMIKIWEMNSLSTGQQHLSLSLKCQITVGVFWSLNYYRLY